MPTPFETEKELLKADLAELNNQLQAKTKRLNKLSALQETLLEEPPPGTVLRFSLSLAGSSKKYGFVAFRCGVHEKGWVLTGRKNALNLLHLSDAGNAWPEVLLAIGDAKVKFATAWSEPDAASADTFSYYRSRQAGALYRINPETATTEWWYQKAWISVAAPSPYALARWSVFFEHLDPSEVVLT